MMRSHIEKISILVFPLKYDISRDCVREVITELGSDAEDSRLGKFVNKVALSSNVKPKLEKREVVVGAPEVLEVINSFQTPFFKPVVKMEQV